MAAPPPKPDIAGHEIKDLTIGKREKKAKKEKKESEKKEKQEKKEREAERPKRPLLAKSHTRAHSITTSTPIVVRPHDSPALTLPLSNALISSA